MGWGHIFKEGWLGKTKERGKYPEDGLIRHIKERKNFESKYESTNCLYELTEIM